MALLCLRVPQGIAKTLSGIDVPGEHVPDKEKHITTHMLGSLGVSLPLDMIGKTIMAIGQATERIKPFHVEVTGYGTPFGRQSMGIPIVCNIHSPELHEMHSVLSSALDEANIQYVKFPSFRPHLTISWGDSGVDEKVFKTPPSWMVDRIVLWCGAFGDERIYTVFELMG